MLFWLSAAWILGIWLGQLLEPALSAACWVVAAALTFGTVNAWMPRKRQRTGWKIGLAAAALLLLGSLRSWLAIERITPSDVAYYNGQEVRMKGWVADYPDIRAEWTQLRVHIEQVEAADAAEQAINGLVLLRVPAGTEWEYGQRLQFSGELKQPAENKEFSYRDYLAIRGIHSVLYYPKVKLLQGREGSPFLRSIFLLRRHAYRTVNAIFPQPEASLLNGILLGLDNDLPAELRDAFRDTGTAHIIAISGFNLSLLAAAVMWLLSTRLRKDRAMLASGLILTVYTILVGGNPAVLRALIMAGMGLLGQYIGRRSSGVIALTLTAAVMTAFNPLLLGDVSFQLSFTATLGLITLGGAWQEGFSAWAERRLKLKRGHALVKGVTEFILLTLAAQVMTLPVVLSHFHRLSLTALIVNPLVLPLQQALMIGTGVATIAGMIWQPLGILLAWFAKIPASITIAAVSWFDRMRGGSFAVFDFGVGWVIASYVLILALAAWYKASARTRNRLKPWLLPVGMLLLGAVTVSAATRMPDGALHVRLLQTSRPAALIVTPRGQQVLLGMAPSALTLERRLSQSLGLWDRTLDAWVLTSTAAAEVRGATEVLQNYAVREVLWAVQPADSQTVSAIVALAGEMQFSSGSVLNLEGGAVLQNLGGDGKRSVISLRYENFCVVWVNGVEPAAILPGKVTWENCYVLGSEAEKAQYAGVPVLGWVDAGTPVHWVTNGERVIIK